MYCLPLLPGKRRGEEDKGMIRLRLLPANGPRKSYSLLGGQGYKHRHQNHWVLAPKPNTRNMTDYEIITINRNNF